MQKTSNMPLPIRHAVASSPDYPFESITAQVKLDQNESAEDFPDHLKAIVLQRLAAAEWNRYPELHAEKLCEAIGHHEQWSTAGTVVATGSNVLIALLIQLAALDGRVVTVKPNFALYGLDARLLGAQLSEVPLREDFSVDFDAVLAALDEPGKDKAAPTGVIYIPRPHAPTGSCCSLEDLERLAHASGDWLLVIDEAYHQFTETSAAELAKRFDHVILLRTFSKAWGLAGIRLGYALTSPNVAKQLRKLAPPFGASVMQTVCAQVALENPGYMYERVRKVIEERERMTAAIGEHPEWRLASSHANFLLIRTGDAPKAFADLLAQGVLVRRQDSQAGLAGCIRVTVGTRAENDGFLKAAGLAFATQHHP